MKTVFNRRANNAGSFPILRTISGLSATSGEVGLEVECEGNYFRKDNIRLPQWKYTHDGSLRGHDNAEYIFKKPLKFEEVPKALDDLWDMFKKDETVLDESNRTSIHVHMNAQDWYLNRLASFCTLYFCVEDILTEWCGDHRVGNLFCLRGSDAPAIVTEIVTFLRSEGRHVIRDGYHYAGLNARALFKFGSLEVRALRGCTDPETIKTWVAILERLYKLSAEYEDPRDICDSFSGSGVVGFLQDILGEHYNTVRGGISYTDQQVFESVWDGVRLAQEISYCRDWSKYNKLDPAKDPFGRRYPSPPPEPTGSDILFNTIQEIQSDMNSEWVFSEQEEF